MEFFQKSINEILNEFRVDSSSGVIITDPKTSLSERKNMVFAGTFITYGQDIIICFR
ncbi:hypothetical protein [Clostridium arbusti]|uniref:hypothetical protein n=1 Tax=Clostridium arbusti TaxID=1137848 RepID=UPI000289750E|nr:hypothetical protein [Clostridium arbusti]